MGNSSFLIQDFWKGKALTFWFSLAKGTVETIRMDGSQYQLLRRRLHDIVLFAAGEGVLIWTTPSHNSKQASERKPFLNGNICGKPLRRLDFLATRTIPDSCLCWWELVQNTWRRPAYGRGKHGWRATSLDSLPIWTKWKGTFCRAWRLSRTLRWPAFQAFRSRHVCKA